MNNKNSNDKSTEYGNYEKVQQYEETALENQLSNIHSSISNISEQMSTNSDDLDNLIGAATSLVKNSNQVVNKEDISKTEKRLALTDQEKNSIQNNIKKPEPLSKIKITDDWDSFKNNLLVYSNNENIDLTTDPLNDLLSKEDIMRIQNQLKEDFGYKKPHCDKYDYILSVVSGVISGLVDTIFVGGAGKNSTHLISKNTDDIFNKVVVNYSKIDYHLRSKTQNHIGNFPRNIPNSLEQSVHYLEMQYKVPYDAQFDKRLIKNGTHLNMSAANHHLFSLAHYPDLVGLIFSILDQFNGTGTYFSSGHFVVSQMKNDSFKLYGKSFVGKIFSGIVNWLGHLFSDAVGSSGAIHKGNRGSGLPIPGTEIFQALNFTIPKTDNITFSKIATKVFENGYDLRHAAATTIPVILNNLLTKLFWALKQYFYHKKSISEIFKTKNNPELNRMLLCSYGTFASIDITDASIHGAKAGIATGGNYGAILYESFSNLNISLYPKLALQGYKEVQTWYNSKHYDIQQLDIYLNDELKRMSVS